MSSPRERVQRGEESLDRGGVNGGASEVGEKNRRVCSPRIERRDFLQKEEVSQRWDTC